MNVQPIRSDSIAETLKPKPKGAKPEAEIPGGEIPRDSFTTEQKQKLMEVLQRQPDVRPDVVAKGQALREDPAYPPRDVVSAMAKMFVKET